MLRVCFPRHSKKGCSPKGMFHISQRGAFSKRTLFKGTLSIIGFPKWGLSKRDAVKKGCVRVNREAFWKIYFLRGTLQRGHLARGMLFTWTFSIFSEGRAFQKAHFPREEVQRDSLWKKTGRDFRVHFAFSTCYLDLFCAKWLVFLNYPQNDAKLNTRRHKTNSCQSCCFLLVLSAASHRQIIRSLFWEW